MEKFFKFQFFYTPCRQKDFYEFFRHTLHRAFNLWASASSLMFIELPVGHKWKPDITVAFLKGKHGDNLPFDGPGMIKNLILGSRLPLPTPPLDGSQDIRI
jgi:hypothetical protein